MLKFDDDLQTIRRLRFYQFIRSQDNLTDKRQRTPLVDGMVQSKCPVFSETAVWDLPKSLSGISEIRTQER